MKARPTPALMLGLATVMSFAGCLDAVPGRMLDDDARSFEDGTSAPDSADATNADATNDVDTTPLDVNGVALFEMESVALWGGEDGVREQGAGPEQFHDPSGIALSRDETEVYVYDTSNRRIKVLDRNGATLRMWPHEHATCDSGNSSMPQALAVGLDGTIYIVDESSRDVLAYSPSGTILNRWNLVCARPCDHTHPIVVDKAGEVIVADISTAHIDVFTPDGELVRTFGSIGEEEWQFESGPFGIVIVNHELLVTDTFGHGSGERLMAFLLSGTYDHSLRTSREHSFAGIGTAMTAHNGWLIAIGDAETPQVYLKGPNDQTFTHSWTATGVGAYQSDLRAPFGLAIASDGYWYVTEQLNNRVQVFKASVSLD